MVWIEPVKSPSNLGVDPAASDTIMVSPIALDTAKTIDATIPESAAGMVIFHATSNFVDPIAKAPSRMLFGTEDIASSDNEAIMGMIMMPTTIPGEIALKILMSG